MGKKSRKRPPPEARSGTRFWERNAAFLAMEERFAAKDYEEAEKYGRTALKKLPVEEGRLRAVVLVKMVGAARRRCRRCRCRCRRRRRRCQCWR